VAYLTGVRRASRWLGAARPPPSKPEGARGGQRDFAAANGYAADDDNAFSITMTPDATVEAAAGWAAQGIHAITFDRGVTGYYAPLANLEAIRAHVRGR
jgi:L-alanine-DL-glutamate epimerase-like enolase superfamily enzyme